jgi:hypothetical protein
MSSKRGKLVFLVVLVAVAVLGYFGGGTEGALVIDCEDAECYNYTNSRVYWPPGWFGNVCGLTGPGCQECIDLQAGFLEHCQTCCCPNKC